MNNKNRLIATAAALMALAALISGCAKDSKSGTNDAAKRYFDAWISVHYPNVQPNDMGEYIIDDEEGSGQSIGDADINTFLFVKYTVTDLDGNVTSSTDEDVQKQIGGYKPANYYGPVVWVRADNYMQAGVESAIKGMKIGGTRKVIIPGWLMTYDRYDTADQYLQNETGTDCIYTIHIYEMTSDIYKWQIDSLERYTALQMDNVDSTSYGYYYQQIAAPTDTTTLPSDTTVYINYIGRLLNGQVFDTNIADTAKFYNIYNSGSTYGPTEITWGENYSALTMGSNGSSMITGFAKALYGMKSMEKGRCAFYSYLGYDYSGSGSKIPAFAMLRFDIQLVADPDDD